MKIWLQLLLADEYGTRSRSDLVRASELLTATDLVRVLGDGAVAPDATVAEFMLTDVVTTRRSAPVREVAETMLEHLIHNVPVVVGDEPVGMITTFDLTAHLARSL